MNDLSSALGELLPAALGIAISPLPIIASILMLLSSRPGRAAPAFAFGWVLGLTAVTLVVLFAAGPSGADTGDGSDTTFWIKLVLGLLFIALAIKTWHGRPADGDESEPPKWMASLDSVGPLAALGMGAALSGLNPKNLALAVTGSVAIASADLDTAATVGCIIVFVLLGSILVVGPVIAYFAARDAMAGPLSSLKTFMQVHNAAIMTVLLAVLGLSNIGKGLGGLLH